MRPGRAILYALVLALLVPLMGSSSDAADPTPEPDQGPSLWLNGPFGRVLGGEPGEPATAAPDGRPLDTWMRAAPLVLETDAAPEDVQVLSVVAQPLDGAGSAVQLSAGTRAFAGPEDPGRSIISASVDSESGRSEYAWLVEVPDRPGSEETLLEMPGPEGLLTSEAGSVTGERGHGCYVYFCAEVGYRPPSRTLEALPVAVGETLTLSLSDESAMVGWMGRLEPLGDTPGERSQAGDSFRDEVQARPDLHGLEPAHAGQWLLELRADLDRDRGWQWFLYRLLAE